MELRGLRNQLRALSSDLRRIVDRDPEQVVQHWALPMIDELLTQAKAYLAGNPVIDRIDQLFSPEMVESQTEDSGLRGAPSARGGLPGRAALPQAITE